MPDARSARVYSLDAAREARPSLHGRAFEDLRLIRATMERAVSFTAVPGWGGVLMGVTALAASAYAPQVSTREGWLLLWLVAAVVASLFGGLDMVRKARGENTKLLSGPGSRFALALVPGIAAGACLTLVLAWRGLFDLLPGAWLLLYGAAVANAGAYSIRLVRIMGASLFTIGVLALASPSAWGDVWMATGFGGIHVAFGFLIARQNRG